MTREAPASLSPALRPYTFVCPTCRGALDVLEDAYRCAACERTYSLLHGIPDFRIFPDPYLDFEEDRARAEAVVALLDRLSFPELLERYWSWSDVTPRQLRARFVATALRGRGRARRVLAGLDALGTPPLDRVLDVGSGTGNLLVEGSSRFRTIVGVDIAMRWLHLSRRRVKDEGLPEPALVCCCAEALPFPDGSFDGVVSIGTLEFARDPDRVVDECARVLVPRGALLLNTVNRFSIAPEPHVALWGVGWLPRAWQPIYVRWRRRASFEHIRLFSFRRLARSLARAFEAPGSVLPHYASAPPEGTRARRLAISVLTALSRVAPGRALLRAAGPEWDVALRRRESPRALRDARSSAPSQQRDWDDLAEVDPLWAISTRPEKRFGRWSSEEFFRTGEEDVLRVLRAGERLGLPRERRRALDFGCGVGRLSRALARRFESVDAVDVSAVMIRIAESSHASEPRVRFHWNPYENLLPFATERFDLVLSQWVLQHFRSRRAIRGFLEELVRVARPGGLIAVQLRTRLSLAARLQPRRRLYSLLRALGANGRFLYERLGLSAMRLTALPEKEVLEIVEAGGAEVLSLERYEVASGSGLWLFASKRARDGAPVTTSARETDRRGAPHPGPPPR